MLSTLVIFNVEARRLKQRALGAFRGEEEPMVTASCCLRSRLEEGATCRPGNSGSRSWPNVPEISSQALVLGAGGETPRGSFPWQRAPQAPATPLLPHHWEICEGP